MTANNVSRLCQMSRERGRGSGCCQNHPQLRTMELRLKVPPHVEGVKIILGSSPNCPDPFSGTFSFFKSGIRKEVMKRFIHSFVRSFVHLPAHIFVQHTLRDSHGNTQACPGLKLLSVFMVSKQIPPKSWAELPELTRTLKFLRWPSHYFLSQLLLSGTQLHHL